MKTKTKQSETANRQTGRSPMMMTVLALGLASGGATIAVGSESGTNAGTAALLKSMSVEDLMNVTVTSVSKKSERLKQSKVTNLRRATDLLRAQNGHLAEYLTSDPKGRLLPEYLCTVADLLTDEQSDLMAEVNSVAEHVEHIKGIVAMQQSYAKVSGVYENLSAVALVEDALRMNTAAFERHRIQGDTRV